MTQPSGHKNFKRLHSISVISLNLILKVVYGILTLMALVWYLTIFGDNSAVNIYMCSDFITRDAIFIVLTS